MLWFVPIILTFCAICSADEITLSESGNCTGQGGHLMSMDLGGLRLDEAVYLLGPAHAWNVTQDGIVTFLNGSQVRLQECDGNVTWEWI